MPESEEASQPIGDKIDSVVGLLKRGRWYIMGCTLATSLATVAVLYQLPNRYTSEATLFVVAQQVPSQYVTPTSTTDLAETLPAITQDVLSRSRMLELVDEFHLFPKERRHLAPEEVIALVRKYITIEPLPPPPGRRESNAFTISFTSSNAMVAHDITTKLTSLFISENVKSREEQAQNTTSFLKEQMEAARLKLAQQESRLSAFKTQHLGELPEQQQGNLAILNGAQLQLQNVSASLDRAKEQRSYLESLLSGHRRMISRGNSPTTGVVDPARPATPYQTALADLAKLKAQRTKLLIRYRPDHPDVVALDGDIAVAQNVVDSLKSQQPPQDPVPSTGKSNNDSEGDDDVTVAQIKSQLESNRLEIANLTSDQLRQKEIIAEYNKRLNLTPAREEEMASILRDYELSKKNFEDLLGKEQQSHLAERLEKQQEGQQFRLVEPPSLPELPSFPKRLPMSLGGVGGGIFLGLAVALLLDLKKSAFYKERDVSRHFGVPLVVGLPLLKGPRDDQFRKVKKTCEWVAAVLLIQVVLVAEAWVYRHP